MRDLKSLKFENFIENPNDIDQIVKRDEQFIKDSTNFKDKLINIVGRFNVSSEDYNVTYDYNLERENLNNGKKLQLEDIIKRQKDCTIEKFSITIFQINKEVKSEDFLVNVIFRKNSCEEIRKYGFSNGKFISQLKFLIEKDVPLSYDKNNISIEQYVADNKFTIIHRICILPNLILEYIIYDNYLYIIVSRNISLNNPEMEYYQFKCSYEDIKKYSFDYFDKLLLQEMQNEFKAIEVMSDEEKNCLLKKLRKMTQ